MSDIILAIPCPLPTFPDSVMPDIKRPDSIEYKCSPGYSRMVGDDLSICGPDGSWTLNPYCHSEYYREFSIKLISRLFV